MSDDKSTAEDRMTNALGCVVWAVAVAALGMIAALVFIFSQPFH